MNTTTLEVKKVRHGWVRIRFTRSGAGCSSWQTIVDAALSYIARWFGVRNIKEAAHELQAYSMKQHPGPSPLLLNEHVS